MDKKLKIAVTGATGQIGYHVCKSLINNGYQVNALVRNVPEYLKKLDIQFVNGDVLDKTSIEQLCRDADYMIHLAAMIILRKDKSGHAQKVNIEGVQNVLEICQQAGILRLVHFSSIHAYSPDFQKPVMDETNPLATDSKIHYEFSKSTAQRNAIEFSKHNSLEVIVLNPSGVIGPEDFKPSNTGKALADIYHGKLPFLPDGGFNWVDVRDVADAAVNALHLGRSGESYLLAGEYMHWRDIASIVRQVSGKKISTNTLPLAFLKPVGSMMEIVSDITGTPPVFTKEAILHLENAHPNVSAMKAKTELGFNNRPIAVTIEDTLRWLKENGKLKGNF